MLPIPYLPPPWKRTVVLINRLDFHNTEPQHKAMSTFAYPNATQGVETWVITVTSFNLLTAVLVSCLVLLDNRHTGVSFWKLQPERRTPIYLAMSIFVSNVSQLSRLIAT